MALIRKSSEIVADELMKQIKEGTLQPGDKLPTNDQLALQYGVGKSTVREALTALKAQGLIEPRQGEGTFVKQDAKAVLSSIPLKLTGDPHELVQFLQVRRLIEGGCAAAAAAQADEQDLMRMSHILKQMEAAVGDEELSRLYDIQFHMGMAMASKNPFLVQMMESISDAMNSTIRDSRSLWMYESHTQNMQLYLDHLSIFEAIRDGNQTLASDRIQAHLDNVMKALNNYQSHQ